MKNEPKLKEAAIMALVELWSTDQGYPPTIRELAATLGMSLSNTAARVDALIARGALERTRGKSRSLRIASAAAAAAAVAGVKA